LAAGLFGYEFAGTSGEQAATQAKRDFWKGRSRVGWGKNTARGALTPGVWTRERILKKGMGGKLVFNFRGPRVPDTDFLRGGFFAPKVGGGPNGRA